MNIIQNFRVSILCVFGLKPVCIQIILGAHFF